MLHRPCGYGRRLLQTRATQACDCSILIVHRAGKGPAALSPSEVVLLLLVVLLLVVLLVEVEGVAPMVLLLLAALVRLPFFTVAQRLQSLEKLASHSQRAKLATQVAVTSW